MPRPAAIAVVLVQHLTPGHPTINRTSWGYGLSIVVSVADPCPEDRGEPPTAEVMKGSSMFRQAIKEAMDENRRTGAPARQGHRKRID